jgi:hypothetical protein
VQASSRRRPAGKLELGGRINAQVTIQRQVGSVTDVGEGRAKEGIGRMKGQYMISGFLASSRKVRMLTSTEARMTIPLSCRLAVVLAAGVTLVASTSKLQGAGDPPKPSQTTTIGIGHGEENARTHLRFKDIPKETRIVQVSTHLTVDEASPNGLNFFAIQVNFANKTWAHGGPQLVKRDGKPFKQVNWGGLVNRGGGSKDYIETDWKKDLFLIQCGIGKPNTVPWEWQLHRAYVLTVKRGKQVHLPAATIRDIHVPERTMWEWQFTIEPVTKDASHPAFTSLLYDSGDYLRSFYLWNEAGYGSHGDEQHSRWSLPIYRTEDDAKDVVARDWRRF